MLKSWYKSILDSLVQESQDYEKGGTQKEEYSPEEVVVVSCPLCGSDSRKQIYKEWGAIGISQCFSCSLLYTSPRLKAPEQVYWGEFEKYYSEARLIFEGKAHHYRDPNYIEELDLIERYKPTGKFLDVGCNMGRLLWLAGQRRWTVVGVEPSTSLSRLAIEYLGLTVYNCFLHELPKREYRSFDVIALSDVFEHIVDPLRFLQGVSLFLADGGIVYIKVPNGRWNVFKQGILALMGHRPKQGIWGSYEHVVHYTHATLTKMLEKSGFHVVLMTIAKPMQTPVWHEYVGHYYQYPSPWFLDWKRHMGRSAFYWLSRAEKIIRFGTVGDLAPNIVALAKRQ